jgi:hypothetical protein
MSINLIERLGICQKALKRYSQYVVSCFHMIQNPELVCLRRVDDYLADLSEFSPLMDTEVVVESPRIFGVNVMCLRHKIANDDRMSMDINVSSSLSKVCLFHSFVTAQNSRMLSLSSYKISNSGWLQMVFLNPSLVLKGMSPYDLDTIRFDWPLKYATIGCHFIWIHILTYLSGIPISRNIYTNQIATRFW